jgi:hypothetical protein
MYIYIDSNSCNDFQCSNLSINQINQFSNLILIMIIIYNKIKL